MSWQYHWCIVKLSLNNCSDVPELSLQCRLVVATVLTIKSRFVVGEPLFVLSIAQRRQNHILSMVSFQLFFYTKSTKETKPNNGSQTYLLAFFKFLYQLYLRGLMFFQQFFMSFFVYLRSLLFFLQFLLFAFFAFFFSLLLAGFQRFIAIYELLGGITGERMSTQRGKMGNMRPETHFVRNLI